MYVPPIVPVPHRFWIHTSGRKASVYGSAPYLTESDKADWQIVESGWTWRDDQRGTIGLGRASVATLQEAQAIADRANALLYPRHIAKES